MPLQDVTVTIDLVKPAGLIGFGKPLILASKAGGAAYKEYADLAAVTADYPDSTEAHKAATALFAQQNRPARIAIAAFDSGGTDTFVTLLTSVYPKDWYFSIITSDVQADIIAVGDYIEANKGKLFAARTASDTVLAAIKAKEYDRTFVLYHSDDTEVDKYPEAAWIGEAGSQPVGSVTWKFKELIGIAPDDLTEVETIQDDGGNAYVTKAGDNVTSEGKVVSGEYIDVIMAKDWIEANIAFRVQKLLNRSPKVPFTNGGISQIEAETITVLKTAFNQDMIATDADGLPLYSTDFPRREETDPVDRATRQLKGAKFSFELAGAVHGAAITGEITL